MLTPSIVLGAWLKRGPSRASTYRLQLHAGFGFREATDDRALPGPAGRLAPLPLAHPAGRAGSTHGYDVVDHSTVSADLGGRAALLGLADAAHQAELGIVVDIVPNHMAMPTPEHLNRQLWETLRARAGVAVRALVRRRLGPWRRPARAADPGGPLEESWRRAVTLGEATVGTAAWSRCCATGTTASRWRRGSDTSDLRRLLSQQHYQLADWHDKAEVLNYRRFFDVDTLVAIRVELDDVFDATHAACWNSTTRCHRRLPHRPPGRTGGPAGLPRAACTSAPVARGSSSRRSSSPGRRCRRPGRARARRATTPIRAIQAALVPAVARALDARWQAVGGEPSYAASGVERQAARRRRACSSPEIARLDRSRRRGWRGLDGESWSATGSGQRSRSCLAHVEVYRAYVRPGARRDPGEPLARLAEVRTRRRRRGPISPRPSRRFATG